MKHILVVLNFGFLDVRSLPHRAIKYGYLFKMRNFCHSTNLAQKRLQIDLPLIITSTADELLRGTNVDDLERP